MNYPLKALFLIDGMQMDTRHVKWCSKHIQLIIQHMPSVRKIIRTRIRSGASSPETGKMHSAFSLRPFLQMIVCALIWGNMDLFSSILLKDPEMARHIRVISIGTGLMLGEDIQYLPESWEKSPPCHQLNWNGKGRSKIYNDPLFDNLWWLEINWTYAGMFTGDGPVEMFGRLSKFGQMGKHMKEVVSSQSWAHYFRVGDTPSVLYVIDSGHDPDDPEQTSWAGKFVRPFPVKKPDYYTDYAGNVAWNYQNPCETWNNHQAVRDVGVSTLEERREEMYAALISKLKSIY